MMEHYDIDLGTHPVIAQARNVEQALEEVGYSVNLTDMLKRDDMWLTPDMSEGLEEALDAASWLSVNAEVSETFEKDVSGSQELTNVVVRNNLTVDDVIQELAQAEYSDEDDTDMLTKLVHLADLVRVESDPEPERVMAYDLLRKSLGWSAEKVLAATDDFSKMLASRDSQGYDLKPTKGCPFESDESDGFQLKTMQRVTSQSLHTSDNEVPHLSYGWTSDGLHVASMDERAGSDEQAREIADRAGLRGATVVKKSYEAAELPVDRPARVLATE